jgi:hypothetical protein
LRSCSTHRLLIRPPTGRGRGYLPAIARPQRPSHPIRHRWRRPRARWCPRYSSRPPPHHRRRRRRSSVSSCHQRGTCYQPMRRISHRHHLGEPKRRQHRRHHQRLRRPPHPRPRLHPQQRRQRRQHRRGLEWLASSRASELHPAGRRQSCTLSPVSMATQRGQALCPPPCMAPAPHHPHRRGEVRWLEPRERQGSTRR